MPGFAQAKLFASVAELDKLPDASGAEIAFVGRSNAGKSSAINTITHRRRLAFVARQPGKTRLIHLFELEPQKYLVDLPGYGYARVSEALRKQWGQLVEGYLGQRDALVGLILIMDARHPLTALDQHLLGWFMPRARPVHILLTKADKLSRSQAVATLQAVRKTLAEHYAGALSAQLFSSLDGSGVEEAQAVIATWLALSVRVEPAKRDDRPNKNPRLKGSKAGGKNALIGIKAPAQGGEAGDDEASSAI